MCALWIVVGKELTAYFPKFVVAGLLAHLAFGYLLDGLWESRAMMTFGEYMILFAIVAYYMVTDLAPAILVGLILCCFSFVLRYSQHGALEFVTTAGEAVMSSNRYRPRADHAHLRASRDIVVARTSCSHLFFGTMASILAEVEPKLKQGRFLFLDITSLRTMDSSALAGFKKLPSTVEIVLVGL
eukprot:CAMPEP_0195149114 /NCGR_PEP_ID=MMETSP0448-20130528/176478_1 /TAXON_ID=66468 /ORGANISM="Heterocapsa triquestra, Strain CCMP 448" /LENGTH=184 /DNA_ID=CAMNT_0040187745 /DNA_START=1 /DNA_END=551 /DNA_ORIENTATION=-